MAYKRARKNGSSKRPMRKRMSRKRKGGKSNVGAKIKKYVKRAISSNIETKETCATTVNATIFTANMQGPVSLPTWLNLVPTIAQGTGVGQRIGNSVRVSRANFKGYVNLLPYGTTSNPGPLPYYVKIWLVSNRVNNSYSLAASNINNNFFELGSQTFGFDGRIMDMVYPVNKELWKIHGVRTMRLGSSSITNQSGTGAYCDGQSPMSMFFSFEYGKILSKLAFDDATLAPTNRSLFLVFQCVSADGGNMNSQLNNVYSAEYHGVSRVLYKDA